MLDLKALNFAVKQIAQEKALEEEQVFAGVESALAAAYKKEYCKKGEVVHAKLDRESGKMDFWKTKTVVDESMVRIEEEVEEEQAAVSGKENVYAVKTVEEDDEDKLPRYNPDRHILIEEAKEIKKDVELGEEIRFELEEHQDFGRIAAQTAKQVILQKIREAERDSIRKEFAGKENEIMSGLIQRVERGNVFVDLGRAMGILFRNETIPGEHYKVGERLRFFVVAVQEEEGKRPGIILSRSHPKFVAELFRLEVPEITHNPFFIHNHLCGNFFITKITYKNIPLRRKTLLNNPIHPNRSNQFAISQTFSDFFSIFHFFVPRIIKLKCKLIKPQKI